MNADTRVIRIEIHVTRAKLIGLGAVAALFAASAAVMSAETQMSATLPSPSGVFRRLITTHDTTLGKGGGTVKLGVDNSGRAALEVVNGVVYVDRIVLRPQAADPTSPVPGELWYRQ